MYILRWSDSIRAKDSSYFCRKAIETIQNENKPDQTGTGRKFILWIVTDARRKTDLEYFRAHYGERIKTIRIVADENVRIERGWKFTPEIDDSISECDLDDVVDWDFIVSNNNDFQFRKIHVQLPRR